MQHQKEVGSLMDCSYSLVYSSKEDTCAVEARSAGGSYRTSVSSIVNFTGWWSSFSVILSLGPPPESLTKIMMNLKRAWRERYKHRLRYKNFILEAAFWKLLRNQFVTKLNSDRKKTKKNNFIPIPKKECNVR